MSKLYFITHPSVQINKNLAVDKWSLSDKGLKETEQLLRLDFWREIEAIYASPERKAQQTAELVSKRYGLEVFKTNCLSELDRSSTGFVEYDAYIEMIKSVYSNPNKNIQGWESAFDVTKRITECIALIMSNHKDQSVAVIGHGATGTLLACSLLNKKPDFAEDPKGTGRYMIIDWDKKQLMKRWSGY